MAYDTVPSVVLQPRASKHQCEHKASGPASGRFHNGAWQPTIIIFSTTVPRIIWFEALQSAFTDTCTV